jgi:hypothetical protein
MTAHPKSYSNIVIREKVSSRPVQRFVPGRDILWKKEND